MQQLDVDIAEFFRSVNSSYATWDVDDVALAQRLVARDAVADDVVDRGADRVAVALVEQRRRDGAAAERELAHHVVDELRPTALDVVEAANDAAVRAGVEGSSARP